MKEEFQTKSRKVTICNRRGLHARAAAKMASLAETFQSEITVSHGGKSVSALSLMGLLMLAAPLGTEIELEANGQDNIQALNGLEKLIHDKFYEDD